MIASFLFFLLLFVVVGAASVLYRKSNTADYLLAGRQVSPWLTALSAAATENSGYMFIGMIGYTYIVGISSLWFLYGFIAGIISISFFVHPMVRTESAKQGVVSYPALISQWGGRNFRLVRLLSSVFILAFLSVYAAAQLKAGGKALFVLFEWPEYTGALIGALIILIYSFSGGLRASIWTDAAQSLLMILAMFVLLVLVISSVGGTGEFIRALDDVSPTYLNFFPTDSPYGVFFGPLLFIAGWVFCGFGTVGQPHVMVRFMAMDDVAHMQRVRIYYALWTTVFYTLTLFVGLATRAFLTEAADFDPELALPTLARDLAPGILAGLILAGVFAASMSTADSQILSCSATLTHDLVPKQFHSLRLTRLGTVLVCATAFLIALYGEASVFTIVLVAWSALACVFGPILIVYSFGGRPSESTVIVMMMVGLAAMFAWRIFELHGDVFEALPGMLAGLATYGFSRLWDKNTSSQG